MCSIVKAGAFDFVRPNALVHNERRMQATMKTKASQPVNFFNTSAVPVPNIESLASPPNEAPNPELLLSCINMTAQSNKQMIINNAIVKK
jgi:hypothetical protein